MLESSRRVSSKEARDVTDVKDAKRKLLFVDDDRDFLEVTVSYLDSLGHFDVTTATDVMDAYLKAADVRFDAICTDYRLGGLTGRELVELLRSHPMNRDVPIAVLSGIAGTSREACRDLEGLLFLQKPISGRELDDALCQLASACPAAEMRPAVIDHESLLSHTLVHTLHLYRQIAPEVGPPLPLRGGISGQFIGQLPLHWGNRTQTLVFAFSKAELEALTAGLALRGGRPPVAPERSLAEFIDLFYANLGQKAVEDRVQISRSVPLISRGDSVVISALPEGAWWVQQVRFESGQFQLAAANL